MNLDNNDIIWITDLAKPERDKGYTRTFYSYPAKFQAKLPRGLIERFTTEEDLVLDPFVGGGTTGLEAMLLNRRFLGYDINPFAIFVSEVKTTYLTPIDLDLKLKIILKKYADIKKPTLNVLDKDDMICLGSKISHEINTLLESISNSLKDSSVKHFFDLALIHSIKIVGRRDFELKENWKNASILPIFIGKVKKMIRQISSIPKDPKFVPEFKLASNHHIELESASVDLIVSSQPYKDKDIEYQKIQIQRRSLKRSKRSDVISAVLKTDPLSKKELCWTGLSGKNYWENSLKSLNECYRLLKPCKFAFFWVGFKNTSDAQYFESQLSEVGFNLIVNIQVELSDDRAASGRSTHHGRPTGMMSLDYLFVVTK
ncbi:MAG: DNA methyltransferase [Candidatus Hodarchaeales archaeon]